ncbi:MAG: DegT/DnrJ/EryC1/StrS family aminotransferase [Verrucomicrobiota bacterium]
MTQPVPFLNLREQHDLMRDEIMAEVSKVIDDSAFAGGPFVERFEEEFSNFCEVDHCVGVGSGTDALWLALEGLGIGVGDEVITVSMTFFATAEAISRTGARPVFVDIEEESYTMNTALLEAAITSRTKAIIPVHLFGQMADMDPIMAIARKYGLFVIEDAAQAHGARYRGNSPGTLSDAACFSFYPGKNLGAMGEAGALVTGLSDLARNVGMIRDHGQSRKYHHALIGWNCRMDGIQAAVLRVKLKYLESNNAKRRSIAEQYSSSLEGVPGIVLPHSNPQGVHAYHVYAIRVKDRSRFVDKLHQCGVASAIHYPIPVHLQDAYQDLGWKKGSFPVSERCADEFVSLPMFPELNDCQVAAVIDAVTEAAVAALPVGAL